MVFAKAAQVHVSRLLLKLKADHVTRLPIVAHMMPSLILLRRMCVALLRIRVCLVYGNHVYTVTFVFHWRLLAPLNHPQLPLRLGAQVPFRLPLRLAHRAPLHLVLQAPGPV